MDAAEGSRLWERLYLAGFHLPDKDDPEQFAKRFNEWFTALSGYSTSDVDDGISRLIRDKRDSFWPTVADLRAAIQAATAGRIQTDSRCATCHGSGWVEAPPYRANGGLLYQGVRRCFDCGKPAPDLRHLEGHQTPTSASEVRDWARARSERGGPTTRAELAAEMAAIARRMTMPKALPARAGEDE